MVIDLNEIRSKGFVLSKGWDVDKLSDESSDEFVKYKDFLSQLGNLDQNHDLYYKIYDRGNDQYKMDTRDSDTNNTHTLHTDGSLKENFPSYVVLACVKPAVNGGESIISNARIVYEKLLLDHPEVIENLTRPLVRDVKSGTADDIKNNSYPIFEFNGEKTTFRYARKWINVAYEKLALSDDKLFKDLDILDQYLKDNQVEFSLESGDVLVIDNINFAHGRHSFKDNENTRLMLRTWIYDD